MSATVKTLTDEHRRALQQRGIDDLTIDASGLYSAENGEALEVLGYNVPGIRGAWPGIVIPFFGLDGSSLDYARFRPNFPRVDEHGKKNKYESPRGKPNQIYLPVGVSELIDDAPYVVITEGEFKALAAVANGIPAAGLVGVYGWVRERPKENGKPVGKKMLHPTLAEIVKQAKRVVIVFDSDAVEKPEVRTAARELARCVHEAGVEVAIVFPPPGDDGSKRGLDDFIAAKGAAAFRELIENAPLLSDDDLAGGEVLIQNYIVRMEQRGEKTVPVKVALSLKQISDRFARLTGRWPRFCGERLFFDDHGHIRWCEDHIDLFATIQSKGAVRWAGGTDSKSINMVSRPEFHSHLRATAPSYAAVSAYPFEPKREDTYSPWRPPGDYVPNGELLDSLLDKFCPSTEVDAALIRAFLLTCIWGGPPGQRPLFVVTGDNTGAQGIGKSKLIEMLTAVVGGAFKPKLEFGSYGDCVAKQLVSSTAMERRAVLLDNTTGVLRSDDLADMITSPAIDGRPSHGRQIRRINLLTWAITTNDLALSADLASRAVVIHLRAPDKQAFPGWESDVGKFVDDHRDLILADAIAAMNGTKYPITANRNRFAVWCDSILALDPRVNQVLPALQDGITESDADNDELEQFLVELRSRAEHMTAPIEFTTKAIGAAWNEANKDRLSVGWIVRRLKAAKARGKLAAIRPVSKRHGCNWEATDEFWNAGES